jgi:hypothetical protein
MISFLSLLHPRCGFAASITGAVKGRKFLAGADVVVKCGRFDVGIGGGGEKGTSPHGVVY